MNRYAGSKGPPDIQGMTSLKVDNLTYRTTMDELQQYFKKYGEVGDIYIPRDRDTHESRGFAFVRFYEERDADDAMDAMDGKVIDGREIRVAMARYGRPSNQYDPQRARSGNQHRGRDRSGPSYNRGRGDFRHNFRDNRRSPQRRRGRSRSRSRSPYRRSRSRSRSQTNRKRSPVQRSASPPERTRSANHLRSPSRSRSRSRSQTNRKRSPVQRSASPPERTRSANHLRSPSRSRSRSRSRSFSRDD